MNWLYRRFLVAVRGFDIDETARLGDVTLAPGCSIGAFTDFVSGRVACSKAHPVKIGNNCAIGSGVYIETESYHFGINERNKHFGVEGVGIEIGDGAFIGNNAIILASVGKNAQVGAGCVVTRPVPENIKAFGNPMQLEAIKRERIDINE